MKENDDLETVTHYIQVPVNTHHPTEIDKRGRRMCIQQYSHFLPALFLSMSVIAISMVSNIM